MATTASERMMTSDYAFYSSENDGQQQSQLLIGSSSTAVVNSEELILPPPSCWFTDDLAAAAPSSSSCSSEEEEQHQLAEDDDDSCCQTEQRFFETASGAQAGNGLSQYQHYPSHHRHDSPPHSSPSMMVVSPQSPPQNKTPPLASFRLNPSLTPPRVVAAPSPSWTEISSQVLPSAAKELLSSSLQRICYTARLSYAKGRWHRKYSDLGNDCGGYFQPNLGSSSSLEKLQQQQSQQSFPDLPPFSSLPWVDRQMVREWRTYLPPDEEQLPSSNSNKITTTTAATTSLRHQTRHEGEEDEDFEFDRARTLVPQPMPRPRWKKTDICHECRKPFGPTRLRHHCRLCGYSFCQLHSGNAHKLPHLGYDPEVPERVCDPCKRGLLAQNMAERVAWRLARCRDLEAQQLTPYFETGIDTVGEAALRITHAVLATARSIPLGAQAHVAVETVEVLRKHGLNGIYGIMLRKEFLAAADLLRKALGINKTAWPLSVHELSAAIFYALAQHRAMRGINPDREAIMHTLVENNNNIKNNNNAEMSQNKTQQQNNYTIVIDETDEYNPSVEHLISLAADSSSRRPSNTGVSTNTMINSKMHKDTMTCSSSSGLPFTPVCTPVADHVLNSLIFYAPIALTFIYATREVDMQLLAAQQGWKLLYASLNPEKDRDGGMVTDMPASAVFVHEQQKMGCLAVRGTATIHDVVTDVRQMPVSFPETDNASGNQPEGWTNVVQGKGLAVCGMASAAVNLFREHIDVILHLVRHGYRIRITGHSLGGGVATLLGVLIRKELEQVTARENLASFKLQGLLHVYAYGPPSSVDANLAEFTESFVTAAVLHDDVVPRLTPTSCRGLLKHLLHIRETWSKVYLADDLMAIGERASLAWAPRWRSGFTLTRSSKISLRGSSRSIKKYCQKKLQSGTKQLLSVQGKLIQNAMAAATGTAQNSAEEFSAEEKKQETARDEGENAVFRKDSIVSAPVKIELSSSLHQNGPFVEDRPDDNVTGPKLLVEMMGGLDNRSDAVIIDGEEFFEADETLIESEEESLATTVMFVDAFDEARSHEHETIRPTGTEKTSIEEVSLQNDCGQLKTEQVRESVDRSEVLKSNDDGDDDEGPGAVVLEEIPLPRMFVPGKIVHIYSHRGVYKAAYVPRAFRELRRISLAGNMLSDHTTTSYYESLLEVRSVRNAQERPPRWTAFDEDDTCSCCASRFTWASTSDSEAQEARDKHNCRSCGTLVCNPCSTNRIPLPSIGITGPTRVCDRCYNDLNGVLTSPFMTNSVVEERRRYSDGSEETGTSSCAMDKPERQRDRRSVVVDDLARRIKESALTSA